MKSGKYFSFCRNKKHLRNLLPLLGCHETEGSSRGSSKGECDFSVCSTELTHGTDPISEMAIIQKSVKLIHLVLHQILLNFFLNIQIGDNFPLHLPWTDSLLYLSVPLLFIGLFLCLLKFMKVRSTIHPGIIFEVMLNKWKLPAPNLVISLVGGEENFQMKPWLRDALKKGFIKAAESTGEYFRLERWN